jgi:hypothetical protein
VNVFDLDEALVRDYERFARSFTRIRSKDIQDQVETLYSSDRFWPEPLLSINPRFEPGDSVVLGSRREVNVSMRRYPHLDAFDRGLLNESLCYRV